MIKFSVPSYLYKDQAIKPFLQLQKDRPEIFLPERYLDSSYDLPGGLIWNGGREQTPMPGFLATPKEIRQSYLESFPDFHFRHTCTNMLLTEDLFLDHSCNEWLKYCERLGDGVIINNPKLGDYIKRTYPLYNIIYSTTIPNHNNPAELNRLSENNLTVLNYQYNHNEVYLRQLVHPTNIEILCGELCIPNCPYRQEHYKTISEAVLGAHDENEFTSHLLSCPYGRDSGYINFYTDYLHLDHAISNQDIDRYYCDYGFCNFKISGRTYDLYYLVELLLYYLIQPQYRDEIRLDILNTIW